MSLPESIDALVPGDIIQLSDITQMPLFEDMVAETIDPNMTARMRSAWGGRVAINEFLRPRKFNGAIADIQLSVMDEAYERLFDAKQRGWVFDKRSVANHRAANKEVSDSFHGFTFTANAKSSGRGIIGQIQSELWYGKVPIGHGFQTRTLEDGTVILSKRNYKQTYMHGGSSVQRYVTKPKIEAQAFLSLNESARKIGFEVLSRNMRFPIIQPIHE